MPRDSTLKDERRSAHPGGRGAAGGRASAGPLLAGRLRVPGLLLFLGLGMVLGTDGLGWIDLSDYELARRIGIIALAADPVRGWAERRLPEIRPVLRPGLMLAFVGTLDHRRDHGVRGRLAARPLHPRGAAARRDPVGHGRRGDLRPPAHLDPATPARPDARGRGGLQRSGGDPAGDRLHRVDHSSPTTGCRHGRAVPAADVDRRGCRAGGGLRRGVGVPAGELRHGRPLPGGVDGRAARSPSERRTACTAPGSSRCTWPGWCSAAPRSRRATRSGSSTRASPGSPRSACS